MQADEGLGPPPRDCVMRQDSENIYAYTRSVSAALLLGAAFAVVLWAALLTNLKQSEDVAMEQARSEVQNLALALRENAERTVAAIDELLIAVAAEHADHPGEFRVPDWINSMPLSHSMIFQIGMADADGILRSSNLSVEAPVDLSDRPHFRHHLDPAASQPYVSRPVQGRVTKRWSIQFSRRLTRQDGSFDGVAIISVDPFALSKFFDSFDLGRGGTATLTGLDGIIRARREFSDRGIGGDLSDSDLFKNLAVAPSGTFFAPGRFDGIDRIFGYAALSDYPLVASLGISIDAVRGPLVKQRTTYLVVGGLSTIVILALAWLGGRESHRRRQTELENHGNELIRAQKQQLDAAIDNISQGLVMFDSTGRLIVHNRRYQQMYGLSSDVVKPGATLRELLEYRIKVGNAVVGDPGEHIAALRAALDGGQRLKRMTTLPDGRVITIVDTPMADGGWVATHEDVTVEKRAEERILHVAHHDALTGLPNRVLFYGDLEQALQRLGEGERAAVLSIDVDHLKRINDTLGHAIGDELLKAVADRLRGCIRGFDFVARLSGDEFAIVQTRLGRRTDAGVLAQRVCDAIREPFTVGDHQVVVSASIGISVAPDDASDLGQLLKTSDMALYEAKNRGRGSYCFYESDMNVRMQYRGRLEQDLQSALAKDEFELFYQPVVALCDNKIRSFEALLRWRHPERGLIAPTEFIPIAEENGLIIPLGEWIVRTACAEAAKWPEDIGVAVNVSSVQLSNENFAGVVIRAMRAAGLAADRLIIEITESVFLHETCTIHATLERLHGRGVRFAMDDFGTGYSSLGYLLSFPFSKIKIDRSFITDIADKKESRAVVRTIGDLARRLNMGVVAEGVETQQQLDRLGKLGCTEIQGYLISPPRPAAEIQAQFRARREGAECAA